MNITQVKVGCCGFGTSRQSYFKKFDAVEAQQTFYDPPQIETLKKWRDEAPATFQFTLKAWQLITHPASSPTYKRMKTQFSESELKYAGYFNDSEIVCKGWEKTLECAKALAAVAVVFQCPASFLPTQENIKRILNFFQMLHKSYKAEVDKLKLVWEPRGEWDDKIIFDICKESNLIHCVDIFLRKPVTAGLFYFRLHGGKYYNHKYTDSELKQLPEIFKKFEGGYCMFNNLSMLDDAMRLKKLLAGDAILPIF